MQANGIVTFTTDFGNRDPYAGIIKGIVLSANSLAQCVDITHEIAPHDIVNGAFSLVRTCEYFPKGTVHVAVVDPGVGGIRKNIAVKTDRYFYVGPDNGIFSQVLHNESGIEIREIKNPPFILDKVSKTFHGRDIFAPCAGNLSMGKSFAAVGPELEKYHKLDYQKAVREDRMLKGQVVSIDAFGNLITNIDEHILKSFAGAMKLEVFFGPERFANISQRYSDVKKGAPLALIGSCGFLEISMNEGNAAKYFMTSIGSPVTVRKY